MYIGQLVALIVVVIAIGLMAIAPPVPLIVLGLIAANALAVILAAYPLAWRRP